MKKDIIQHPLAVANPTSFSCSNYIPFHISKLIRGNWLTNCILYTIDSWNRAFMDSTDMGHMDLILISFQIKYKINLLMYSIIGLNIFVILQ